ncbi:MAG: Txe/YoeB family addiction module toxin [Clostridiales bacterium]|jgi:toxin YoeB|nr:Txe/YoeB family addiction module toxin [Clostridiales bacterium]
MVENLGFSFDGWDDYVYWQNQDRRTLKKINKLIKDIFRNGNSGIGHPEPLKGNLSGKWSREIDEKNRLIYQIFDDKVVIYQCRGHYDDK